MINCKFHVDIGDFKKRLCGDLHFDVFKLIMDNFKLTLPMNTVYKLIEKNKQNEIRYLCSKELIQLSYTFENYVHNLPPYGLVKQISLIDFPIAEYILSFNDQNSATACKEFKFSGEMSDKLKIWLEIAGNVEYGLLNFYRLYYY